MPEEPQSEKLTEVVTRWGLVVLAALVATGALLRIGSTEEKLRAGIDQTTLLYFGVAGALLLLRQVKTLALGQFKFELIERLREQQQIQEVKLADISLILPLLLPEKEVKHIRNLSNRSTEKYVGNAALREELRRLRKIGLIAKKGEKNIGDIKDALAFDLADYVELTELGRRWAAAIQQLQAAEAPPADQAKP